jgi:hypothetical protein
MNLWIVPGNALSGSDSKGFINECQIAGPLTDRFWAAYRQPALGPHRMLSVHGRRFGHVLHAFFDLDERSSRRDHHGGGKSLCC